MTDHLRPFPLDEEHPLIDRVALIERDLVIVRRMLGISPSEESEDDDQQEPVPGVKDHRAPQLDLGHPAAWRVLAEQEITARWEDLRAWVDWLIATYRLPPRPWEKWWTCPGACEELSALRAWHRELVDIAITAMQRPPEDVEDPDDQVEWRRNERASRLDIARSHVEWHEALWQVVARVAGVYAEQKPLLTREAEATDRTTNLREEERTRRSEEFAKWRTDRESSSTAPIGRGGAVREPKDAAP